VWGVRGGGCQLFLVQELVVIMTSGTPRGGGWGVGGRRGECTCLFDLSTIARKWVALQHAHNMPLR
jgi:hypothetical protein